MLTNPVDLLSKPKKKSTQSFHESTLDVCFCGRTTVRFTRTKDSSLVGFTTPYTPFIAPSFPYHTPPPLRPMFRAPVWTKDMCDGNISSITDNNDILSDILPCIIFLLKW